MGPPRGLHSPHPDNTPGGQSNRPAGIWVAGAPSLHRPVSGTREPGGGGGGRPGLGARPVRWRGCTHTGGPGLPARPKHRAWTRAEVWAPLAERGLHLLSSQALRKLQRIFAPCSWSLRSAPAGSPAGPLSCEWPPCHSGGPRPGKSESRLPKTRPPRRGGCRGAQALGRPHPQASPGGVLGRATVPSGAGTRASGPRPRSACRRQAARSWRQ